MVQHLNRIAGAPSSSRLNHDDLDDVRGDKNLLQGQSLRDMYKSRSQTRLHTSPLNRNIDQDRQIKNKIFATKLYQKASPAEKARLEQDHGLRLPNIKSTLYSNPKFVNKSKLMVFNKMKRLNPLDDGHYIERSRSQMLDINARPEDIDNFSMPKIQASQLELFNQSYADSRNLQVESATKEKQIAVPMIDELVRLDQKPGQTNLEQIPKFIQTERNSVMKRNATAVELRAVSGSLSIPTKALSNSKFIQKNDRVSEVGLSRDKRQGENRGMKILNLQRDSTGPQRSKSRNNDIKQLNLGASSSAAKRQPEM